MATLYVTAPPDAAPRLARVLVTERLAACVNRVECRSTYRWDDEVVTEDEEVLLVKTTAEAAEAATDRIEELHPHDVPCVERFDEADVLPEYADWIESSVDG